MRLYGANNGDNNGETCVVELALGQQKRSNNSTHNCKENIRKHSATNVHNTEKSATAVLTDNTFQGMNRKEVNTVAEL